MRPLRHALAGAPFTAGVVNADETGREREVLGGVANGLSNELIAKQLGISSRTVEIHRANMLDKIGANHTSDAIRLAIEASLLN